MLKQKQIVAINEGSTLHSPIDLNYKLDGLDDKKLIGVTFTDGTNKHQLLMSQLVNSYSLYGVDDTFSVGYQEGVITWDNSKYRVSNIIMYGDYIALSTGENVELDYSIPFVMEVGTDGKLYEVGDLDIQGNTLLVNIGDETSMVLVF